MYDKLFNIAVLAALGYLIVGDKVLPTGDEVAVAAPPVIETRPMPEAISPPSVPEASKAPVVTPAAEHPPISAIIPTELAEPTAIGQPAPAAQDKGQNRIAQTPVAEAPPQPEPQVSAGPRYQIAEGNNMMSSSDRHRQLQDLAENMELVFLDLRKE